MKQIFCLLLTVLVLFTVVPAAFAYDGNRDCSIEVVVKYNGTAIDGGKLKAVRVGYVDDTNWVFRKVTDHKEIAGIGTHGAVNTMVTYFNAHKDVLKPVTVEITDGVALFEDLAVGLYLIFQEDAASGYNNLAPFLVTLPYTTEDGTYVYDVTVHSKTELCRHQPKKPTTTTTTTGTKLPQTGQLTWPIPWLASSGMVLFILGWWLCFGRRNDMYEN